MIKNKIMPFIFESFSLEPAKVNIYPCLYLSMFFTSRKNYAVRNPFGLFRCSGLVVRPRNHVLISSDDGDEAYLTTLMTCWLSLLTIYLP